MTLIDKLREMALAERQAFLANNYTPEELEALPYVWELFARPDQLPPTGEWRTWALIAGRGAGKSRSGAEWVRERMESGRARCIALAAATQLAARKQMVEGQLLAICPPWNMPTYEMATGVLRWPNGGVCHIVTAESFDRIRGYNFDGCWADELSTWPNCAEAWLQLQLAVRLRGPTGEHPRFVVTTTPKATPTLKEILADPGTVVTRASSFDNAANLSPMALATLRKRYEGTSIGRQELYGELLLDVDEALWRRDWIDNARVSEAPELVRVVVAIDPSVSNNANSAECGIVVAGRAASGDVYVLADNSARTTAEGWARRAAGAYEVHMCDALIAEVNQGGALVQANMRSIGFAGNYKAVSAARGKQTRAEPIASLYEQGRVHHVGAFPLLEDQLCGWVPGAGASPDRLDALVWACTELALGRAEPEWVRQHREWTERMRNGNLPRFSIFAR